MLKRLQFFIRYRLTIFIGLVILVLSLMSSSDVPSANIWDFYGADKIVHFTMYFAFTFILLYEKHKRIESDKCMTIKASAFLIIAIIASSGIIELIQPALANRSCEFFDFVANSAGVISGFYAFYWLLNYLKR
jgi:hypothetical protein